MHQLRLFMLTLLATAACTVDEPTRVFVTVSADQEVAKRTTQLQLVITREPGDYATRVAEKTIDAAKLPLVFELFPEPGGERLRYGLEVSALEESRVLTSARLESGYIVGKDRFVALRLEEACIDVLCASNESCHDGACRSSSIPADALGTSARRPPNSYDIAETRPATDRDASVAPRDASTSDAELDAGDLTPPSVPKPDAAAPLGDDDAGDGIDIDGSVRADAATPGDAQTPPVDAAPAAPCMPAGEFMVTATETGGTCKLPPGSFPVALHGKLEDFLPANTGCSHTAKVALDGCSLTFTLNCPVVGLEEAYTEMGEASVVSADHIVINSSTVVLHPESQNCTSLRTYDVRRIKP